MTRKLSYACCAAKRSNPNAADSGGAAANQPARHFINFSAEATCQVVPGRGYRILDIRHVRVTDRV